MTYQHFVPHDACSGSAPFVHDLTSRVLKCRLRPLSSFLPISCRAWKRSSPRWVSRKPAGSCGSGLTSGRQPIEPPPREACTLSLLPLLRPFTFPLSPLQRRAQSHACDLRREPRAGRPRYRMGLFAPFDLAADRRVRPSLVYHCVGERRRALQATRFVALTRKLVLGADAPSHRPALCEPPPSLVPAFHAFIR